MSKGQGKTLSDRLPRCSMNEVLDTARRQLCRNTPGLAKTPRSSSNARLGADVDASRALAAVGCPFLSCRPGSDPTHSSTHAPASLQGEGKGGGFAVYLEVSQCGPSCRSCSLIGHAVLCGGQSRVIHVAKPFQRPSHDQEVPNKGRLAPGQPLEAKATRRGSPRPRLTRCLPASSLFSWPPTTDTVEMLACLVQHDGKARRRKTGLKKWYLRQGQGLGIQRRQRGLEGVSVGFLARAFEFCE